MMVGNDGVWERCRGGGGEDLRIQTRRPRIWLILIFGRGWLKVGDPT